MDNSHQSPQESNVHPAVIDFVNQLTRVLQSQTPDSSQNVLAKPPSIQLQRPDSYDGSRNVWKLDGWLRSIERLKEYYSWDDIQTFRFARTLLSGRAEAWFSSQETNGTGPTDWSSFKQLLIITFRPANAEDMVRDRLYNTRQTSSIQAYVDTFMDISMLLNSSGLTAQQVMDRFLSDLFFRGLRDKELIHRIRGISIENRTMERVLREALDFEAAHHSSVPSTAQTLTRHLPGNSSSISESTQVIDDPMDCDVLQSRRYHPSSSSNTYKDNRTSRGPSFNGTCHYCSRKGHKITDCRTRAKDLSNYESKMKERYRSNQGANRSGFTGSANKSASLNAIDATVTEVDHDCTHQPKSTTSNKVTDSSSYSPAVPSESLHDEVILTKSESALNHENKSHTQSTSLSSAISTIGSLNDATHLPIELVPIQVSGIPSELSEFNCDHNLSHSPFALDAVHLSHLNTVVSCNLPLYHGVVMLSGGSPLDIHVLIDNGASESYISPHLSKLIAGTHHHVCGREVETAGGNTSPITERVEFNLDLQGHSSTLSAFVFETKFDIILGRSWLKEHKPKVNWLDDSWSVSCCLNVGADGIILPVHDRLGDDMADKVAPTTLNYLISKNQVKKAVEKEGADACFLYLVDDTSFSTSSGDDDSSFWSQLPKEFPSVFLNTLPGLPPDRGVQHVIDTGDAKPLNRMPFRMSPAELNELNKQLNELLSLGLIRRSSSPWGSPVLLVKKKDGSMRMCIDYRAINSLTKRNATPLPRIDECLDHLQGASFFTTLDLKSGYHQIRVQDSDIPKTAFNTRYGKFEFLVLPFGLSNAPPTFQSMMNQVLNGCIDRFALVYLDDILIFSRTKEDHKRHVVEVLKRLQEAKLILNVKKCTFAARELEFLGFKINASGILPSDAKVKAIHNWPRPTNVQEVRQFIGLAQHYRRFCPNFSSIATPLTELTHGTGAKKRAITWNEKCEESFLKLKALLTSPPVLRLPNLDLPFRIETDASDFGVGAVLLQPDDKTNTWAPVAYESRKLSIAEQKFPAQERELIAIIHALRTWRCLVDGCKSGYTILCDHKPLLYFQSQTKPTSRLVRWIAEYELYSPNVQYKPGKENAVADALSRSAELADHPLVDSLEPEYLYATWDQLSPELKADWPLLYLKEENIGKLKSKQLRDHIESQRPNFSVRHNRVYRKVTLKRGEKDSQTTEIKEVQFVPFEDRADWVEKYHFGFGHAGFKTMMHLMESRYWWPSMKKDVQDWLRTCPQCQVNSRRTKAHQDVMHPLPVPKAFERWHLDFVGELPTTINGNKWLLTAVDSLTNWPIAKAVPVASQEVVADFIYEEIVMRFGCPAEIVTDRGANFTSGMVEAYLRRVGVNHKLTSAFHPRTNSKVERYNGIIKQMLRKYANGAIHRWDDFVQAALWATRVRKHSTTGYSPFYLVYGREPRLPGDEIQPYLDRAAKADPRTIADITSRELEELGQHRAAAEFRLKAIANKDKERWDAHIKKVSFEPGDLVMLSHEGRYGLEPRFKGPYMVVAAYPEYGTYRLETMSGEPLNSLVHVDRLKAAEGEKPITPWYDPTASRRIVRETLKDTSLQQDYVDPIAPVSSSVSGDGSSAFMPMPRQASLSPPPIDIQPPMHIPPPLIGPETIKIPTLPQVDDRRSDNGSNNDILSLTDEDIISLCHSIVNEDSRANDQDINMNDNSDGNEEIKPDITNQEDEAKDDDSLQTVASNLTISSARISEVSASSLTPQIPASISLEVHRLPSMEVIGVSSDSRSDTSDESVLPPSSSSSASEKSDTASPMLLSSASEVNNQDPSDTVDERIDISDFVRDTEIQEVSSTSDSDQDVQDMSDEQANRSSCLYSQPIINIVGSNNQVVLVQGHDQAVTLMSTNNQVEVNMTSTTSVSLNEPSSSHEDIDSHPSPLPASLPTSDVQVEVIDVTSSPAASSATLPTITHTSPLLLTAPSTILPSDVSPPPPQPPSSKPFAEHEVVQRRTSGQEGDNVMATNEGGLSNQVNLDFANTEEIPAFLRNWNANKKRKFKPKPCSNSPAKRQRRSGPDSF